MSNTRLSLMLGLFLAAAPVVVAQGQKPATATSAAPKGAHPKSKAEGNALSALNKMAKDPATTADQLDAAITAFVTAYPTSDYIGSVYTFGLQFNQTPPHVNYEKSVQYGEEAIKASPDSVYALATVADIIPNHVSDTDLDRDQRLKEASDAANALIKLCQTAGDQINGQPFTEAAKHEALATAYSSLARIANLNKDYANTVANYKQAVTFDSGRQQAVDYFYMANAQIQLKDWPGALASLNAAAAADPATDEQVQQAIAHNKKFVEDQIKAGH